jgi:hypothetical protein
VQEPHEWLGGAGENAIAVQEARVGTPEGAPVMVAPGGRRRTRRPDFPAHRSPDARRHRDRTRRRNRRPPKATRPAITRVGTASGSDEGWCDEDVAGRAAPPWRVRGARTRSADVASGPSRT